MLTFANISPVRALFPFLVSLHFITPGNEILFPSPISRFMFLSIISLKINQSPPNCSLAIYVSLVKHNFIRTALVKSASSFKIELYIINSTHLKHQLFNFNGNKKACLYYDSSKIYIKY